MDELIERLADALRKEFPFLDGPKTGKDAFQKAAAGIVKKMGMTALTLDFTVGGDPVSYKVFMLGARLEGEN